MRILELRHPGWSSGPVGEAIGFRGRLRGIHGVPEGFGVLLPVRSVHGFGLDRAIRAVALGAGREVLMVTELAPGGVVTVRGGRWMLELPLQRVPPEVGRRLTVSTLAWWPEP
ncbi:MAG: hypothetical protein R6X29_06025 [Acidimicrobiia bacterium]